MERDAARRRGLDRLARMFGLVLGVTYRDDKIARVDILAVRPLRRS